MKENRWEEGYIEYTVTQNSDEINSLNLSDWKDGYIAFSNWEYRLNNDIKKLSLQEIMGKQLKNNKISCIKEAEGYLMEINLWKQTNGVYEEISIEREDSGFLAQHWRLSTKESEGSKPCYYRDADTQPRANLKLFEKKELKSIEVIEPENRLHFFITTSER